MSLLEVKNLQTSFQTELGTVYAIRDVSFRVDKGEAIGIVGESGSGKSVTMLSVMGLLSENGEVTEGEIIFNDNNISSAYLDKKAMKAYDKMMRDLRGNQMGMIFQDPMTYLNPVLKIETQMIEPLMLHLKLSKKEAVSKAIELLRLVGIPSPEKRIKQYPYQFSGGMRQRIIIAMALSCNPKLIIADEPTTALDVTIQAQVLDLLNRLRKDLDTSVIMITHDLGVVAKMCSRILIMYGGKIVEQGTDEEIFYQSKHPYTQGLLRSINNPNAKVKEKLVPIKGTPPDLLTPPIGCPFVDRCEKAMLVCKNQSPIETEFSNTHKCSCWLLHHMSKGGESLE